MNRDFGALSGATVLITGGAGFVGSNLARMVLSLGAGKVHIVDNLLSAEKGNVPADSRVKFTEGSITDDSVLACVADEYDHIFHLATFHGNQSSISDPLKDHANNLYPTLRLLEHVKGFKKLRKFVYSAAGCAVAEKTMDDAEATVEEDPVSLAMDSPYSISKIAGEFYAVYYHNRHKVPTVRARFQNVYGPGEILGAGQWRGTYATVWRNVTPVFIYKALKGVALPVEGDGAATRDFIFVEDIVRGLISCALYGEGGDVYNLASGAETSVRKLAETINRIAENRGGIEKLPGRGWDKSGKRFGSVVKSREKLGFTADVGLEEGLRKTVEWTKANMAVIEGCIARHAEKMSAAANRI
ncbi:MAG: NAD-dependent epimerase/dehydratase family protein [Nitrospinae bacterium]|nr:NAD-dependent epimerase/dehydratase family protein [Nitrospinota bacterium]